MNAWELIIASLCYVSAGWRFWMVGNEYMGAMFFFYAAANVCLMVAAK